MTVHENQLSKHTIQMQEHDLMGLNKALEEKEKVCEITKSKIDK
jgi:site-specific recombinase XerD